MPEVEFRTQLARQVDLPALMILRRGQLTLNHVVSNFQLRTPPVDITPLQSQELPGAHASPQPAKQPGYQLLLRAQSLEWLSSGVRVTFDRSIASLPEIASTIDAERQCCRFLQFDLRLEPDDAPVLVTITGPEGTREFLDALLSA